MKAILTRAYSCAPEGHTVLKFETGVILHGRAAEMALADGAAIEIQAIEQSDLEKNDEVYEPEKNAPKKKKRNA